MSVETEPVLVTVEVIEPVGSDFKSLDTESVTIGVELAVSTQ